MGESNRVRWSYTKESTWGVTPGSAAFTEIRRTGGSLKAPMTTVKSNQVRSDRKIAGFYQTGLSVQGGLNIEMAYGDHDDLWAGLFMDVWTTALSYSGTLTITAATKKLTRAAGSWITDGAKVGMWVKVSGSVASSGANNGYHKVTAVTALDLTVAETLVDEASGPTITVKNDGMLRDGTTFTSFSIEKEHLDLSPLQVFLFTGIVFGDASISVPAEGLITGSFNVQGKSATRSGAVTRGSLVAAGTNDTFNSTSNIADVTEGGVASTDLITKVDFKLNNNIRQNKGVGHLTPQAIKLGSAEVTGSLDVYFQDGSLVDKYLAYTASSLSFRMTDAAGHSYILTFPQYHYTGDLPDDGQLNGDVMLSLPFGCFLDPTTGCQVQLDRFV